MIKTIFKNLQVYFNQNWKHLCLQDPLFCLNDKKNEITWNNYITQESYDSYYEYYDWVFNNGQYSIRLGDDSLLQVYYKGDKINNKCNIIKAKLSYLPFIDLPSIYFRFDYDIDSYKPFTHNTCHIHFGYNNELARLTLKKFPMPSEFIKFVLSTNYNIGSNCYFDSKKFIHTLSDNELFNHYIDFL